MCAVLIAIVLVITLFAYISSLISGGVGGFNDVKDVKPLDGQSYLLINNVDEFPKIVRVCKDGVAFAMTTRGSAGAILRVQEWDRFCIRYVTPTGR